VVLDKPLSAEALAGAIGQMEIFIGTRMHSNIFALHQYIPLLPIGYLHKTQGIADMIGLSQWVIDIKNIDSAALSRALEKLWVERSDIKHHLMNVLPAVFEDARLPGQMIGADYQRFLSEAK
jgi:colanic acid/amylovoran biosynthesis protein